MISRGRILLSFFLAWLVFLAIDFLAHAALLRSLWDEAHPALKPPDELFRLIPLGYLSFLLLTLLMGWLYLRIYPTQGNPRKALTFGALFGGLFAGASFFGWYSFLSLPLRFVAWVSLLYLVELTAVGWILGLLLHPHPIKKRAWLLVVFIISGFILGIVVQNL
jgi:hypothetical protein